MDRNQKIAIVLLACAALIFCSTVMFGPLDMNAKDINDLGTFYLYPANSVVLESQIFDGDTLSSSDGLLVRLATTWSGEATATLYIDGHAVEVGEYTREEIAKSSIWRFDLDSVPAGYSDAFVAFGGMYSPDVSIVGSTVHFVIFSDTPPTYDPPVIDGLADMTASVGETVSLIWWYTYSGPARVVITLDGEVIRNTTNTLTTGEQSISASRVFDEVGVHEFVLTITPDTGIDVTTDSVTVTVEEEIPVTTTITDTTTETGTATETTTTDGREPPPPDIDYTLLWIGAIGAVLILVFLVRRKR